MHYDSTAFSRNGKNTIETVEDGFTEVIGSATDLSPLDIIKASINLIICKKKALGKSVISSQGLSDNKRDRTPTIYHVMAVFGRETGASPMKMQTNEPCKTL